MRGGPGENKYETVGRKNNCMLNFCPMYFVRTNKEIHLSLNNQNIKGS